MTRTGVAIGVALTLAVLLTLPAGAGAADIYVGDSAGGERALFQFTIAGNRTLAPKSPPSLSAPDGVRDMAVSSDGRHAYSLSLVISGGRYVGVISGYRIAGDGTLSPNGTATAGQRSSGIALSPDGRSAYVTNSGDGNVSQFTVTADGKLTSKSPATIDAGAEPDGIAVSPEGDNLYVANYAGRDISQYTILRSGKLAKKPAPTQNAAEFPRGIAVSPDGRSAYVANEYSDSVSQYAISANGELQPMAPPSVAAGARPTRIAVSPDGLSAYVANREAGGISQYSIAADGSLTPKSPASVRTSGRAYDIAIAPDGASAYVTTEIQIVNQYTIAADGTLVENGAAYAGSRPRTIVAGSGPAPSSSHQLRLGKLSRNKHRGTAELTVRVYSRGKLTMWGRGIRRVTRSPRRARKLRLEIVPRHAVQRRLENDGTARVRVSVRFRSPELVAATEHRAVKLVRAGRRRQRVVVDSVDVPDNKFAAAPRTPRRMYEGRAVPAGSKPGPRGPRCGRRPCA